MREAQELFESSIEWLRQNYGNFKFFTERDLVWTVQTHILSLIEENELHYKIFNDYPILPGKNRSLSADLAILNEKDEIEVAVEFKYEPSHKRKDIPKTKFPVVFWGDDGVGKDVKRIQEFIEKEKAKLAYSVFIDEGGSFRKREPHPRSKWLDWGSTDNLNYEISVLWSKAENK